MAITRSEFNVLFKLNPAISQPHHTPENGIALLNLIIDKQSTDFEGTLIDFKYISKKWKDYVLDWQRRNGKKDPQYISAKDKLMDLYEYLNTDKFLSSVMEFNLESDPRFKLCFGNVSVEYLELEYVKFNNLLEQ